MGCTRGQRTKFGEVFLLPTGSSLVPEASTVRATPLSNPKVGHDSVGWNRISTRSWLSPALGEVLRVCFYAKGGLSLTVSGVPLHYPGAPGCAFRRLTYLIPSPSLLQACFRCKKPFRHLARLIWFLVFGLPIHKELPGHLTLAAFYEEVCKYLSPQHTPPLPHSLDGGCS